MALPMTTGTRALCEEAVVFDEGSDSSSDSVLISEPVSSERAPELEWSLRGSTSGVFCAIAGEAYPWP